MCQGGHVRSVGLKYLLTYKYKHEALACGWESNTTETRSKLFEWADIIVILQKEMEQHVPVEFHDKKDGSRKLFCYDVGPDHYGNPFHPQLLQNLDSMIQTHKLFL
jgi:predicted protein tyrosine phosphatase